MLVLSRKVGETILIGEQVSVTVVRIAPGVVRLGIDAPDNYTILRSEIAGAEQAEAVAEQEARP
jgi:carbon storage regulator